MEADKDSNIIWEYEDPYAHHDAQWLTDGLLYVAATDYIDGRYTDIVKRVDLKGNVLWEYNCAEHLYEIESRTRRNVR